MGALHRKGLSNGTQWGEHISLQAMADMLSLRIHVHSTIANVVTEVASRFSILYEFQIALIAQAHYVAMIAEQTNNEVVSCSNSETVDGSVDETTPRRHMSNAHLVIEQTLRVSTCPFGD
jgi:hypothetical protein